MHTLLGNGSKKCEEACCGTIFSLFYFHKLRALYEEGGSKSETLRHMQIFWALPKKR